MSVKSANPVAHYRHLSFGQRVVRDWKLNKWKYLLIIPVLVYLALFCYKPMYGLVIAFKNASSAAPGWTRGTPGLKSSSPTRTSAA